MSILKYVERLKRMDDLISRKATGTPEEFAAKLKLGKTVLMEDLRELRELGAKIGYCRIRQTYFYEENFNLILGQKHGYKLNSIRGGYCLSIRTDLWEASKNQAVSFFWLLAFLLILSLPAIAQSKLIQGRVLDKATKSPLPFANVFIANSTIGTTTSIDGFFSLLNPTGSDFTIVVSFVGYRTATVASGLLYNARTFAIEMEEDATLLDSINVKAALDVEWRGHLQKFTEVFLGEGFQNNQVEILNPEVIDFQKTKRKFSASANRPIIISNHQLGYTISYFLQNFELKKDAYRIIGNAFFQELPASSDTQIRERALARSNAFRGSFPHFIQACINGTFSSQGYHLFAVERLTGEMQERFIPVDSIPVKHDTNGRLLLELPKVLQVNYTSGKIGQNKKRVTSKVELSQIRTKGSLLLSEDGFLFANTDFELAGEMAAKRMGTLLPRDYTDTTAFSEIRGSLKDVQTGEPIKNAIIFLTQSTYKAVSDEQGHFVFRGMDFGYYDLVVYVEGYKPLVSKIRIADEKILSIQLTLEKEGKKIHESKRIRSVINKTLRPLLGDSILVLEKIEQITELPLDNNLFRCLVAMINPITGYRLTMLCDFTADSLQRLPLFAFEELKSRTADETLTNALARANLYFGSQRHLLKSIAEKKTALEGYALYRDGMNEFSPIVREKNGAFSMAVPSRLFVKYRPIPTIQSLDNKLPLLQYPIIFKDSVITIDQQGVPLNQAVIGAAKSDIYKAFSIPRNYYAVSSPARWKPSDLQEHFTIVTDRPYYYTGDKIFFTAFATYANPQLTDSLSRVLHIQLISEKGRATKELLVEIANGFAFGTIELPLGIEPGLLYLTASTRWMKNFRDLPHVQTIHVLPRETNPDEAMADNASVSPIFSAATNKTHFTKRERIDISLELLDTTQYLSVSVAVTDAGVVKNIPQRKSAQIAPSHTPLVVDTIEFPLERTIHALGRVITDDLPTAIRFIQPAKRFVRDTPVDKNGFFNFEAYDFKDSAEFIVQPTTKGRRKKINRIEWQKFSSIPPDALLFNRPVTPSYKYDPLVSARKINLTTDSTRMLDEVVIRAPKPTIYAPKRLKINNPDFVLTGDAINRPGYILQNIAGKVPGLIINCPAPPSNCQVVFGRSIGSTIMGSQEPLILLNDMPVPLAVLMNIDPVMVERIEFTRRINVFYGDQGAKGIISIYTKTFSPSDEPRQVESEEFYKTWVTGFNDSRAFVGATYEQPKGDLRVDDRILLFWQPSLTLNKSHREKKLTFYAADIPTQYRIQIRGVNQSGDFMESTFFVEIK